MKVWLIHYNPSDSNPSDQQVYGNDEGLIRLALNQTYRWWVGSATQGATKVYYHGNSERLHVMPEDWTDIEAEEYAGLLMMKATAVTMTGDENHAFTTSIAERQTRPCPPDSLSPRIHQR